MKMKFVYLILVVLLFSCESQKEGTVYLDLEGGQDEIKYSDVVDSLRYLTLETSDECLIGNISKITIDGNLMFILDTQTKTVFVYNLDGNFKYKINNIGRGVGEYISITASFIDIQKKQILVYDDTLNKVLKYSYSGKFINEVKQDKRILFDDFFVKASGEYVCFSTGMYRNKKYSVWKTDTLLNMKRAIKKVNPEYRYPFNRKAIYNYCCNTLSYYDFYENKIYNVNDETVVCKLSFDLKQRISDDVLAKSKLEFKNGKLIDYIGESYINCNYIELSYHYFFNFYSPRHGDSFVLFDKRTNKLLIGKSFLNDIDGVKTTGSKKLFSNNVLFSTVTQETELNPVLQLLYLK